MRPNSSIIFDGSNRDWLSQLWNTYEVKYFMNNVIVYLLQWNMLLTCYLREEKIGFKHYVEYYLANKYTGKYVHIKIQEKC